MLTESSIYEEFKLPIDYVSSKKKLSENLYDDLELLEDKDIYDYENDDSDDEESKNADIEEEETLEGFLEETLKEMSGKTLRKNGKAATTEGMENVAPPLTKEELLAQHVEKRKKFKSLLKKKLVGAFSLSSNDQDQTNPKTKKTTDTSGNKNDNTLYKHVFAPTSKVAEKCLLPWSQHYSTDINFLRDSQTLYGSMEGVQSRPELVQGAWDMWSGLKNDDYFLGKYNYVDISFLQWLNHSEQFLTIYNIYNISSPVINLLSPLALLIVPFIIMKIMKVPITPQNYVNILKKEMKTKGIGRLLTGMKGASWHKRVYLVFCIAMYFLNIYQNIKSCISFRHRMIQMKENYALMRDYCDYTLANIDFFLERSRDLLTYAVFNTKLEHFRERIQKFSNSIQGVCMEALSPRSLLQIGKTMQNLYTMYFSKQVEQTMLYTMGFNGYMETLCGLRKNIEDHSMSRIRLLERSPDSEDETQYEPPRFELKKMYHPNTVLQVANNTDHTRDSMYSKTDKSRIVKNNIKMKHNRLITGPNAAGKTTLLKATTINLLLSQQLGYGFYKSGKLTPFDHIHCYINIPDTGSRDSLFQAEARRCATILNSIKEAPDKTHFCIFDELFSGTNPYEAISGAKAYLTFIANKPNVRFMLTTHFIKLCEMFKKHKHVKNYNMASSVKHGRPKYTYKVQKGISKTKGGIFVLQDLEYPDEILKDAKEAIEGI